MLNMLESPTYEEIVELSNSALMNRMQQVVSQINDCRAQGKSTSKLACVYKLYEEEWLKRLSLAWNTQG